MRELSGAPIQLILKPNFNVEGICSMEDRKKKRLKIRIPLAHLRPHKCSENFCSLKYVIYHLGLSHVSWARSLPQS